MRRRIAGLVAALACAAAWLAAPAAASTAARAPEPAAAAPEGLAFFVGAWDIVATDPQGTSARFRYEVRPFVGTGWLSGHGRSDPPGEESRDVWGRDEASGELMRIIFDAGGTYAIVRSPGWQGERLVLEGDARSAGGVVRVRETITRLSADSFLATWEAYRQGAWSAYSVERVTRRGASGA